MGTFTSQLVRTLRRTSLTPSAFILAALPITALFLERNQITEY